MQQYQLVQGNLFGKLNNMPTKIIDNWSGRLTRDNVGDMNSGMAKYDTTFGADPFSNITNLTWFEQPIRIDNSNPVLTDCIMAMKPRLELGITYVYAIGSTGRLYKIQSNQPSAYNPNLDTVTYLTTLTADGGSGNPPTFKYGSSINFFGATEQIYVGHDTGCTRVNFDGTGETWLSSSFRINNPRPGVVFQGVLYLGNGENIAAIDSTATVTSHNKISPAFSGLQVRDLDISPDGNYLQIIASRITQSNMIDGTQDTSSLSSSDSYKFYWNGVDTGVTAFNTFNGYSINTNTSFADNSYTMGYDLGGAAIYNGNTKVVTLQNGVSPNFGAMFSSGNMLSFGSVEQADSVMQAMLMFYGQYDNEVPKGLFRFFRWNAQDGTGGNSTDLIQVPCCSIVSNLFYGASSAGYTNNQVGSAKIYFSVVGTSAGHPVEYRFYKFNTFPTGQGGDAINGVYETQNEILSSNRIKPTEIRIYTEPLSTSTQFQVDLIDSSGTPMSGGTKVFVAGSSPVDVGTDFIRYTPQTEPTYSLGLRITNQGIVNWVAVKAEIDYDIVR